MVEYKITKENQLASELGLENINSIPNRYQQKELQKLINSGSMISPTLVIASNIIKSASEINESIQKTIRAKYEAIGQSDISSRAKENIFINDSNNSVKKHWIWGGVAVAGIVGVTLFNIMGKNGGEKA